MRKEAGVKKKVSYLQRSKTGLNLSPIRPLTENQQRAFQSSKNMVLDGWAGTGKTFISMYLALDSLDDEQYSRVVVIRSAVSTRDIGFLKGSDKEKVEVYEAPYIDIATELYGCGTAYETLKSKGKLHFMPTSFIRGTTMRNAVVIVDECQNMTYHELDTLITRVGENCRIIFCGDFHQSDLKGTGIKNFYKVLKRMDDFDFITFTVDDIVRSEFVKNYLITKHAVHGEGQVV